MNFLQKIIHEIIHDTKEFDSLLNDKKEDFNVNVAKKYYDVHLQRQEQRRKDYIYELEEEIKQAALDGHLSIITHNAHYDFMSFDYLDELKKYFENKGFNVEKESSNSGLLTDWLRISWE